MDTKVKEYVNKELGEKPGAVILEIGAHYGEDTLDMFKVFNNPEIHCFEPSPRNLKFLHKYFKENNIPAQIHEVALFNEDGEAPFLMSYAPYPDNKELPEKYKWMPEEDYRNFKLNNSGGSSLKGGHKAVKGAESVIVKTARLDSLTPVIGLKEIDFMWIDVQGAEKEVLEGAVDTLKNTTFVWIEYGETQYEGGMTFSQTAALLEGFGFKHIFSRDNNSLFRKNDDS